MLVEANIDALVGPTHHYGGLGVGNLASIEHRDQISHPRRAALEGLEKAAWVHGLGIPQFMWLPPARPRGELFQAVGFSGALSEQIAAALEVAPHVVSAAMSSAFMWAANSATVSPPSDAADGKYHITLANLVSSWHRAFEASERRSDLQQMFPGATDVPQDVVLGDPLPAIFPLRDEGAANHMRLSDDSGEPGLNIFVYGDGPAAERLDFLPRQSQQASRAIARLHRLDPLNTFFLQQHPQAIGAGAFHNDVVATSHRNLLLHHEQAFWSGAVELRAIEARFHELSGQPLKRIVVTEEELSLADAVRSYFFNSQIVSPAREGRWRESPRMVLVCPQQCREIEAARRLVDRLLEDDGNPLETVHFVSLRESMANGGGPACLRLRLPIRDDLLPRIRGPFRLSTARIEALGNAIERWYPEQLSMQDFLNPEFRAHVERARQEVVVAVGKATD